MIIIYLWVTGNTYYPNILSNWAFFISGLELNKDGCVTTFYSPFYSLAGPKREQWGWEQNHWRCQQKFAVVLKNSYSLPSPCKKCLKVLSLNIAKTAMKLCWHLWAPSWEATSCRGKITHCFIFNCYLFIIVESTNNLWSLVSNIKRF